MEEDSTFPAAERLGRVGGCEKMTLDVASAVGVGGASRQIWSWSSRGIQYNGEWIRYDSESKFKVATGGAVRGNLEGKGSRCSEGEEGILVGVWVMGWRGRYVV